MDYFWDFFFDNIELGFSVDGEEDSAFAHKYMIRIYRLDEPKEERNLDHEEHF